jgi:hypothetical protein
VLRIVSAVSGPGDMMTKSETPMNAAKLMPTMAEE